MKLPSFTQSTAESLTAPSTPQAAGAVAAGKFGVLQKGADVAADVYKATSAASYTRATTEFIAGYTEKMAEFERSPNMGVAELEAMGVPVPADYIEEAPMEDGRYRQFVPNWAVAEHYHKKVVQDLIDEGAAQTKTEAARSRFISDFTQKYGNEQLLRVQEQAYRQMQQYQKQQLLNDVEDLLRLGRYSEARSALTRGVGVDTISSPDFHAGVQKINQLQERAYYNDVIETGTLEEQKLELSNMLYWMENEGRYGGYLMPDERVAYINRLKSNLSAAERPIEDIAIPAELERVANGLKRGDTYPREDMEKLQARVVAQGKPQYVAKMEALMLATQTQQMYRYAPQRDISQFENMLAQTPVSGLADGYHREYMEEMSKLRQSRVKADAMGYFVKNGPDNLGDPQLNAQLKDAKDFALDDPETFIDTIEARYEMADRITAFLGREPTLLTGDETLMINTVFNTGNMEEKRQVLSMIGGLSTDLADEVYSELTAVAQADSAIFIAAGQQLNLGDRVGADILLKAYAERSDPLMQKYLRSKGLRQAVSSELSGFAITAGSKAADSMRQAVLTTYAYVAKLQGIDEKTVDTDLMKQATQIALGGTLTNVGRTRVLKVKGKTTQELNLILERTAPEGWERIFMGVDFAETNPVDFKGLPDAVNEGTVWFVNVPGSTRNMFMVGLDENKLPTLYLDDEGDPVLVDFTLAPIIKPGVFENFFDSWGN